MTSQFNIQGSLKALVVAATAVVLSMPAMDANAQRAPTASGGRGRPVVVRPTRPVVPPRPVVVVSPCYRGGPGITRC
jgi:hypothetical protein